ncbi:MAG: c-type cytochrome [Proteobacteria bacterium]|nr:c-type cytochrome [Pseudomonadota bacterium]
MKSRIALAALAVVALFGAPQTPAQDAPAQDAAAVTGDAGRGKTLAYTCLGCHGIENYKNANPVYRVPLLRGQHPEYIAIALNAYKNGERSHATMHSQAVSMTEQDIADVAVFLAGTPIVAAENANPVGKPPTAAAACVACHGTDGVGIVGMYPTLAGQYPDYIERALHDYQRGNRKNDIMAGFVGELTEADIAALAAYYSRQQPKLQIIPKRRFWFTAND